MGHYDLLSMDTSFPMGHGLDNHDDLIDDFGVYTAKIVYITEAQEVVNHVFDNNE
jgi:hypothetical protein